MKKNADKGDPQSGEERPQERILEQVRKDIRSKIGQFRLQTLFLAFSTLSLPLFMLSDHMRECKRERGVVRLLQKNSPGGAWSGITWGGKDDDFLTRSFGKLGMEEYAVHVTALELQDVTDEDIENICHLSHLRVLQLQNPQLKKGYDMLAEKEPPILSIELEGNVSEDQIAPLIRETGQVKLNGKEVSTIMELPDLPW